MHTSKPLASERSLGTKCYFFSIVASKRLNMSKDTVRRRKENSTGENNEKPETVTTKPGSTESNNNKNSWHFSWGFLKYVALVAIAPAFLNHASLYRESQGLKPHGELYDIGWGQKVFMGCAGRGTPTVILDAPTGMSSDIWFHTIPEVAKFTKVCYYDRGGLGFSDRPFVNSSESVNKESQPRKAAKPFTTERMVEDFHRLFAASSDQAKPFVLVGAGLGAVNLKFYTQMFEDNVASLILVNPLVEGMFSEPNHKWTQMWHSQLISFQTLQFLAAVGVTRIALILGLMQLPLPWQNLPKETEARQKYLLCKPAHLSSVVDELFFANESLSQFRTVLRIKPFPKKDVSIISSGTYDKNLPSEVNRIWSEAQQYAMKVTNPSTEKLHLSGSATTSLFEHSDTIVRLIKRHVLKYRHSARTAAQ